MIAAVEASSECLLVFLVLASLPPGIVIFLMSGLFSVQGIFDAIKRFKQLRRHGYEPIGETTDHLRMKKHELYLILLFSLAGILAQAIGVSSSIYFIYHHTLRKMERRIAFFIPVCLFFLSFTWASEVQKYTFVASEAPSDEVKVTSEAPSDAAEVTSEAPSDTVEVTSEAPLDTVEVTSEAPSDTVEVTSEAPSDAVEVKKNPGLKRVPARWKASKSSMKINITVMGLYM